MRLWSTCAIARSPHPSARVGTKWLERVTLSEDPTPQAHVVWSCRTCVARGRSFVTDFQADYCRRRSRKIWPRLVQCSERRLPGAGVIAHGFRVLYLRRRMSFNGERGEVPNGPARSTAMR